MVNGRACQILLVAAFASGQGKTTLTAALARKLTRQGRKVRVFKTGPDFLDPMLLERACGAPVYSLDLWIVGQDACRRMLAQAAREADVVLIEGVMGLYDGNPSSADLARAFGVPVVVVIDAGAMAQTAGAVVAGLRDYGPVDVVGVIANRVGSAGHADMVSASLRGIPLLARLPRQHDSLPERHLGLLPPDEVADIDRLIDNLAEQLVFDVQAWARLPECVIDLPSEASDENGEPALAGKRIAIARDAAFAFLYPANLDHLQAQGAQLAFFSPLADEAVPEIADGVWLPGGYPELHAQALSGADRWKRSIQDFHAQERPISAECGGMMALADSLTDLGGKRWDMAGLLPGAVVMQHRLAGLGAQAVPTLFGELRGHTFHYSQLHALTPAAAHARKNPSDGKGEAVYLRGSLAASYFHAYFPSCPEAIAAFFSGRDWIRGDEA